jgi:catechol 2,3-dioxygenase-like lactoylglutathione lyase family enzyme
MSCFYKCRRRTASNLAGMNQITIVTLLVLDQDAAIDFYTKTLGFELVEDKPFGESRWVTVALPNRRGLTLALELAATPEDKALVGRQAGSHAFLGIDTSDCEADYRRMKTRGVRFLSEPHCGPWGTGVQLEDLYGNKLFLSQQP